MSGLRKKWGDDDDDELPETHETKVDNNGFKVRTEYKINDRQQKLKITSKIRVIKETIRTPVAVKERRQRLRKFGNAIGVADESNVTIVDYNEVLMLDPKESEAEDSGQTENVNKAFGVFAKKQQMRALQRKYELDDDQAEQEGEAGGGGGAAGAGGAGGRYVPPSARGASGMGTGSSLSNMEVDDRDLKTLRVSNISTDTKEADLQELFEPFGSVLRIYLAKDKETMQSRGFAFVSFNRREDGEKAMRALQGYGYDHLILKLEWAKPSAPKDVASEPIQFRSGYGKALAQDTDQKVSYASNLTTGTGR
jgi:translation initiation factor 3 subunit G